LNSEAFKPIAVKSPVKNITAFKLRCLVDLQLKTIASFLEREMPRLPEGNIIDIGAGESPWRDWLPPKCIYRGIDVTNSDDFGMSQSSKDVLLYDGKTIPFDPGFFDGAICIEVLEHAYDPEFLTSEVLKPNAPLLLTAPWSARRHHIPHDFHRFTKERLYEILSKNGFEKITINERGNDYCVVFNKTFILLARNLKRLSIRNFFYKIPLLAVIAPYCLIMLAMAHISLTTGHDDNEDPLGYFCKAYKK
jgi:hypothetical protein